VVGIAHRSHAHQRNTVRCELSARLESIGDTSRSWFAHDLRRLQSFTLHAHAGWPVAVAHVISIFEVFLAGAVELERVFGVASFPALLDGEWAFVGERSPQEMPCFVQCLVLK